MKPRHFGAASWDDEMDEEEEDELDLSGFVSSNPPPPPVVERKRGASGMGNAGPRTQAAPEQEPAQLFGRSSNLGYVPEVVTAGNPLNPLYADDNALLSPKIWVASKSIGTVLAIAGLGMAIHKGARPVALPVAIIGGAAYLHPALGFRHGLLADKLADKNVLWKGTGLLGTHAVGAVVFRNAYRVARGKGMAPKFGFAIRG